MLKITVFFRSNEASNRYISATKAKSDEHLDKNIATIHYENLDKRKFENYFKKCETPDYIFVWHDEEILIEYIKTNYPNVKIETMSGVDRIYNSNSYYGNPNRFQIYDRIKDIIEKDIPIITHYKISGYDIVKKEDKQNRISGTYYLTEKEAKIELKDIINKKIKYLKSELMIFEDKLSKLD